MAFRIEVDQDSVAVVADRFERLADAAEDLREPFDAFISWMADRNEQQFASRGARHGSRWQPLSRSTLKQRRGSTPLVRTGRMRDSLTGRPFPIERIETDSFEFGTDVPYYRFHHEGTRWMPARPVMVIGREEREHLTVLIGEHLEEAIRGDE